MNALFSLFKKRPNILLLMVLLIGANIVAWLSAFTAFSNNTSLLALSLIAWCYGLRHAVDADHIAAIDSATRKLMQQKKRALTTGAWFSLGHSTIVVLASIGIALTTSVFKQHMAWFQNVGGLIGTSVSAAFLLILATINLIIFCQVWKAFRHLKRTGTYDGTTEDITVSGPLNFWSILVFPALFTCGMALIDCLDSILMVEAYGWAFNKPQRKLYYNMTITGTSVIVALFIGGLEALGLLSDAFSLQGGLWDTVSNLSDHMGNVGFVIIGVFIGCWIISAVNYRWKKYDGLTFS
ncbi:MAG: HoxN/HupN/NixA family nickel/cobalt transporter [Citrobacter freundii]|nr:HoxN/HupN/NixA family nickel/cobalt transporter [Citrobacter freundii]